MYRVFIDCSSTVKASYDSGIQRVVRNLIRHGQEQRMDDVTVHPVVFRSSKIQLWEGDLAPKDRKERRVRGGWVNKRSPSKFQKILRKISSDLFKSTQFHRAKKALRNVETTFPSSMISFCSKDILLLADASWDEIDWQAVEDARKLGVRVGSVIYDLIPLTHPEFVSADLTSQFSEWLTSAQKSSDFFMAISEATKESLEDFQNRQGWSSKPTATFDLGSSLNARSSSEIRSEIRRLFDPNLKDSIPTFVVVGTLAPHKNHKAVLDAFDLLRSKGTPLRLVVIGKRGWNVEGLQNRIRKHPDFGKLLLGFDDARDSELKMIYQGMHSLVFASFVEGYGLPIVEALSLGNQVLASDIPVFREVSRNQAIFFDPHRPESLAKAMEESMNGQRSGCAKMELPDWGIASQLALKTCVRLAHSPSIQTDGKRQEAA